MIRELITVPVSLFKTTSFDWDIDFRSQDIGEGLDGGEAVSITKFSRWVGTPTLFLFGQEVASFRALRWQAQGRAGIYRIRICDPLPGIPSGPENGLPFSTGQTFSTGNGFLFNPFYTCTQDVPAGSTVLRVSVPDGAPAPIPGQIVSDHLDWLIGVTSVTLVSGSEYELTVQPGLRAAIAQGDSVYMAGTGRFVATDDLTGNPSYGGSKYSTPQLSFREYLLR